MTPAWLLLVPSNESNLMNIRMHLVNVPLIRLSIFDISRVWHEGGPLGNSEVSPSYQGNVPLILVLDWQNLLGQSGSELWQPKKISVIALSWPA